MIAVFLRHDCNETNNKIEMSEFAKLVCKLKHEIYSKTTKPTLVVKHVNMWPGFKITDLKMLHELLEENFEVVADQNSSNYDLIIDGVFGNKKIDHIHAVKIFFTGEAYQPRLENYDLSIGFNYIDNPKYIRVPLAYMTGFADMKISSDNFRRKDKCNPNKKYFACFLVGNGTSTSWLTNAPYDGVIARDLLFHRLSLYKRVESGGGHLNNRGKTVPKSETMEFLSECKFVIAYENQSFPGYITEKPYQAYAAGAIPIYYADKQAVQDINKGAVIFAPDFINDEALVDYIIKVDRDDQLYCDIWQERLVNDPVKEYDVLKNELRQKLNTILNKKTRK